MKETIEKPELNASITIDNALVNAAQGLLLSEKRILMFALTKLYEQGDNFTPIKIEAKHYAELYNIKKHTAYEQIMKACESMIKKQVCWQEERKRGLHKIQINWISSAEYSQGLGFVQIAFTPEIKKYLIALKKHFTTYKLKQARALRSIHSWRMLELFSQFKKTGWREISIDEFSSIMEITERQKKDFFLIRMKLIEPAIKELEEKDGWKIHWSPIRKGMKVVSLFFKFQQSI